MRDVVLQWNRATLLKYRGGAGTYFAGLVMVLIFAGSAWAVDMAPTTSKPETNPIEDEQPVVDSPSSSNRCSTSSMMARPVVERNYYTTEKQARVRCVFGMATQELARMTLTVTTGDGRRVAEQCGLMPRTEITIPLSLFPEGRHACSVSLLSADQKVLVTESIELVKLAPNPGCEVKIDHFNRVILKEGQPFFPFGLFVNGMTPQDRTYFFEYGKSGFNAVVYYHKRAPLEAGIFDLARTNGFQVIDWYGEILPPPSAGSLQDQLAVARARYDKQVPSLNESSQLCRRDPNFLAHYTVDEPNLTNPEVKITVAEWNYRRQIEADPYHPVLMCYACNIPVGDKWTAWGDILGYDPYVDLYTLGAKRGQLDFVAIKMAELNKRADAEQKPVLNVLLAEALGPNGCSLFPAEQYCQTYLSLIHGAKGLFYFVNLQMTKTGWDTIRELARQMETLGPAILAPEVSQTIRYAPGVYDVHNGKVTPIQAAGFRHPDGRLILLAANSAGYPVDTTFKIHQYDAGGFWRRLLGQARVRGLFDDKTYTLTEGMFEDRIEAFGTRAYVLPGDTDTIQPLELDITMAAHPDQKVKRPLFDVPSEVKRCLNRVLNPSFERISNPESGLPDYCRAGNRYVMWPPIGTPGAGLSIDTNAPWHGRNCLRIERSDERWYVTWSLAGLPGFPKPTADGAGSPYVLSLYMRAAQPGVKVKIIMQQQWPRPINAKRDVDQTCELTTDWQRYVIRGTFTNFGRRLISYMPAETNKTIWVDAIQLEPGVEPTAFRDGAE